MSHPVWIPKAAAGCLEPAPASLSTHGVVVLSNHCRAHKVALTPIHLGTLVGKYARHGQAPWGRGEEQVSGGYRGGEGCTPKGDPAPHRWGTSQPSTAPYPATKDSSSSQHTSYCTRVPLSPPCRSCKLVQKMLLGSEGGHQSVALTSLIRCRCCHMALSHFSPVLVTSSSPFSSLSL